MVSPTKKKRCLGKGMDGGAGDGGWSTLPADLLGEVSGSLSYDADVLHIHQVCAHWRASTAPLAAARPWIVAGHETSRIVSAIGEDYSFWLPHGGGQRIIPCFGNAPPAGLPYCCGTPRGWLAQADAPRSPTRLVLWEPVSRAEIAMPPLPRAGFAPQIFLSGDPLAAAASPGWMAIASQPFSVAGKWQTLFFWRPGDAAWTPQRELPMDRIDSAAFHGGFFYLTVRYWYLYAYDLRHDAGAPWPPPRVRSTFVYLDADRACELSRQGRSLRAAHVVAAADGVDLLLAVLYWECHRRSVQMVAKVFRMEWAAAAADLELSPVTDLGEHALLLGRGDALALSAAEFPAIRRNCVYFVEHDNAPHPHWAIAMDLGANASELIPHPQFQEDEPSEEDGKCAADRSLLPYSWFCLKQPFFKHK